MKLEFISNTGCFLEHNDIVIGMDIWLTQGAFEGSWFHYPPLRKTKYSLKDCKYIYISHIHPDHFDIKTLSSCNKEVIFIVPNYFNNLLERKIKNFGFKNVISLGKNEKCTLPCGADIKLFGQFVNNLHAEANFGNMIDSAILIQWAGKKILNCNDNYLDNQSAISIKKEFGEIDLALMPHSASGPYPASFDNLNLIEKKLEANRLQDEYINHFFEMTKIIKPKIVVPMAAEYAIVGRFFEKNSYIGLASAFDAVKKVNSDIQLAKSTKAIHLDCGSILDIETGNLEGLNVRNFKIEDLMTFASNLKDVPYSYDWESSVPSSSELDLLFKKSRENIWHIQERLNWKKNFNVYFNVDGELIHGFNCASKEVFDCTQITSKNEPYIECKMPIQLFYSILTKKSHWNNAEGGLHINFYRKPNVYIPEVFVLLSFLHLPHNN